MLIFHTNILFYKTCTISAVFHACEARLKLYFSLKRHKSMTSVLLLLPAGVKVTFIFTFTRDNTIDGEKKFTHKFAFA